MKFPSSLQSVFDAVAQASRQQGIRAYALGGIPHYVILGDAIYLKDSYIRILLEIPIFDVSKFHKSLTRSITINTEVENTPERYCVLSKPYILDFKIFAESSINAYARFNTDDIYYDIIKQQVSDSHHVITEETSITSLIDPNEWTAEDILGFSYRVGMFSVPIISSQLSLLQQIDLTHMREPISVTFTDLLIEILLTDRPGSALRFIAETFLNGQAWLFEALLDVMIHLNVPAQEDVSPSTLFVTKKFELIDVYGKFFLSKQTGIEQPDQRKSRLNTVLRLLFDTPNLKIEIPYIDKVSVLTASMMGEIEEAEGGGSPIGGIIRLFDDPPGCEYGDCPPCDPADCEAAGKGPCCCCHSVDVISEARFNCHSQTVLSCNEDGTQPGPGEDAFPVECPQCYDACEVVLGIGGHAGQNCDNLISTGTAEGWWTLPSTFSPCSCECFIPSSTCQLTCVTCENLFCESLATVTGSDCHYNISLSPGTGCCGTPAITDWCFVIDFSGSMAAEIDEVRTQIGSLIDKLKDRGAQTRLALVKFGQASDSGSPYLRQDWTLDKAVFQSALLDSANGDYEPDLWATHFAATLTWGSAAANFIMLIADEASQGTTPAQDVIDACHFNNITVFVVDGGSGVASPERELIANATGGQRFDLNSSFADVVDSLEITVFPTSCQCVNYDPIPLVFDLDECRCDDPFDLDCLSKLPDYCHNIPIRKCFPDQDCQSEGFCDLETPLSACGNTILIEPENVNMICCADVGFGCDCDFPVDEIACCGPECPGSEICDSSGNRLFDTLEDAQDFVWCECFNNSAHASLDTPNCEECCCPDINAGIGDPNYPCDLLDPLIAEQKALLDEDPPRCCQCHSSHTSDCCGCCRHFADGAGTFDLIHCRPDIDIAVAAIWETCGTGATGPTGPTGPIGGEDFTVCDVDKCIVGEPTGPLDEDRCGDAGNGCTSIRNPAVVTLNNGIGLVAYESMQNVSVIKIQQFKTSSRKKVLPNREFNFGRLQHQSRWTSNIAKLYYYEDLPQHIINSADSIDPLDPNTWGDTIVFRTGPLHSQSFPIVPEVAGDPPYNTDSIGDYITFRVPTDTNASFPSSDDVYNIRWFILDKDDGGLIGDATDVTTEGKDFIIDDNSVVNNALQLPPHVYNGEASPVAYPSIANAKNYSNAIENSHFVYLSYQALEDDKWNIYLRQIRLSEYEKEEQISDEIQMGNLESIDGLDITNLIYRIICTSDDCEVSHDDFALSRTIVMEVLLDDGREVFNEGLTGEWPALCSGHSSSNFPKHKVFVQFRHTIIADRCPDQFGFDALFYDWQVGQEFDVPAENIAPIALFSLLALPSDTATAVGEYSSPLQVGDTFVKASSVGAVWYDNIEESTWSVISLGAFDILSQYKGLDISEPILVTENELGHCTHPVVKVTYNNDVFIAYEYTTAGLSGTDMSSVDLGSSQIALIGTAFPSTSLPVGIEQPKQIDDTLNYFLQANDFTYREEITSMGDGVNQLPDMFVDTNDVIHITWQSNQDGRWEIYYANSEENIINSDNFVDRRITNHAGRSLRPSIDGSPTGRLYIVWHDNRFGNWEVMMAYVLDANVVPLYQQDPYLASIGNPGYNHSSDTIPLLLRNDSDEVVCVTNITVNFYEDRLLSDLETAVKHSDWPFAFTIPGAANDTTTETFDDFDDWICQFFEDEYTQCDPYCYQFICTSPEFDTTLTRSIIDSISITLADLGFGAAVEIAFRGSDIANDPNAELQWTDYVAITSSGLRTYVSLGLSAVSGKYKQVRIRVTLDEPVEPAYTTEDISIDDSEDDGYFHFTISINSVWNQGDDTLTVRAFTGTEGEKKILLRFPIEAVGTTTVVDMARLYMTATANKTGTLPVDIGLLNIADASTLDWSSGFDPSTLPSIVTSRTWFIPATGVGAEYNSSSIEDLVQDFVDMAAFVSGNYVGLVLSWNSLFYTGDSDREFASQENVLSPPRLEVEYYDEPSGVDDGYTKMIIYPNTWVQGTSTFTISNEIDDPSGHPSATHVYLRFPVHGTSVHEIRDATLRLVSATTHLEVMNINLWLLDTDDASTLDWSQGGFDVANLPERVVGYASGLSYLLGATLAGDPMPMDIYTQVQYFMEREGFNSGQYIGFEIVHAPRLGDDPTAVKTFYTQESGDNRPSLQLEKDWTFLAFDALPWQYEDDGTLTEHDDDGNSWVAEYDTHGDWSRIGTDYHVEYSRFLRFQIEEQPGANIVSVEFRMGGTGGEPPAYYGVLHFNIWLLDVDNCRDLDWTDSGFDPDNPPSRTTDDPEIMLTPWDLSYGVSGGASLVQSFVDRPGYNSGQYMGLEIRFKERIYGTAPNSVKDGVTFANRELRHGYPGNPSYTPSWPNSLSPKIRIISSTSGSANDDGCLYNPLDVPEWVQGEESLRVSRTVDDEKIYLRFPVGLNKSSTDMSDVDLILASNAATTDTLQTRIYLLDEDDISTQDWTSGNFPITDLPSTIGTPVSFLFPATTIESIHRIDITSLINLFRARTGYVNGNYVGLRISYWGTSEDAEYKSFLSAELGTTALGTTKPEMEVLLDIDIAAANDDGGINDIITSTPNWEQFDNELVLSKNFSGGLPGELSNLLLRFPIDITNLTDINSVFLNLTPSTTTTGSFGAKIHLLDIDDASEDTWDDSFNPSNRPERTGSYVSFEVGATTADVAVISPSVQSLVESFIARSGYRAGNYMALEIAWDEITSSDDSTRTFYSKESSIVSTGVAPLLRFVTVVHLPVDIYWPIATLSVTSIAIFRLCLAPGEEVIAQLDLTPATRIDQAGNAVGSTPLPMGLLRNRTYFISVTTTGDDGDEISMPNQRRSISCYDCTSKLSTWNLESCSVKISVPNTTESTQYMNFQVTIYYDEEKERIAAEFNAFPGHDDLAYFTVEDNNAAQEEWADSGLRVARQQSAELLLWPNLSPTAGILCGITYYIDIKYCQGEGTETSPECITTDLEAFESIKWKCNCESIRWEPRFEDSPENLREIVRWQSSGSGFSDTRLTETIGVNNVNPVIRMRSFGQGVVIYSTNRHESINETDDYKLFASVFNVAPAYMYASGAQVITSLFSQLVHRSDIPICRDGSECFDDNGDRIADSTLLGTNPALAIDQFDNLFLAFEEYTQPVENDASDCQEFVRNKQQIVKLHTCGLDPTDLFALPEPDEEPDAPCEPDNIVSESFVTSYEPAFLQIIRKIRVLNEFVRHHITRDNVSLPIVEKCDIKFEIVGGPEAVAIRLRNGRSDDWSVWHPFEPEIGENVLEIEHTLTSGGGWKQTEFQVATYTGLMTTATALILADYLKISYDIKFYKPLSDTNVPDGSTLNRTLVQTLSSASDIWVDTNQLNFLDAMPVAAIRPPVVAGGDIIVQTADYIFLEIIPSLFYMEQFKDISDTDKENGSFGIDPTFDLIQQGGTDQFNLPTIWERVEGIEVFRGVIEINRDNQATFKDGLATIIPHFQQDCSTEEMLSSSDTEYVKDPYNLVVSGIPVSVSGQDDVWADDRNTVGQIEYPVQIRPATEDPYFVFGDPDYRLKKQNE